MLLIDQLTLKMEKSVQRDPRFILLAPAAAAAACCTFVHLSVLGVIQLGEIVTGLFNTG